MYDPAIGRWSCIDPMADATPHLTPFHYCYNSPIINIDPDGMFAYASALGVEDDQISAAGSYTGTPKYVWKKVNGKMVGDWEGGSSDVKKGKKEEVAKGAERPQEAKGRHESGNNNPATAGTGATTYIAAESINGMGNGGSVEITNESGIFNWYRGREDSWMLGRGGVI